MKSMMEEASSVSKAIENCWNRAGKPQEFTVKVLELPQKNFLGITTKAAKIALFFNQPASASQQPASADQSKTKQPKHQDQRQHTERKERRPDYTRQSQRPTPAPESSEEKIMSAPQERQDRVREPRREYKKDGRREQRPDFRSRTAGRPDHREQRSDVNWNQEMVDAAQEWLKETLIMMDHPSVHTNAHFNGSFLKIELSEPISQDPKQEEILFKSWSNLLYEVIREKFKMSTRGLRLVIESRKKV